MNGTLYLCATPIGNLEDITLRALRILKEADIIAAEDTRHTLKLLNHYGIKNELTSYHEHNKNVKNSRLLEKLKQGKNIALVTDAGMPLISDPGFELVSICREENIPVTVVPGVTAFTAALVLSGIDASCFTFFGFLPRNKAKKAKTLQKIKNCAGTAILYEAPHHLAATLGLLANELGERRAAIVREITKIHEEVKCATLPDAAAFYAENPPKGEFVIVIEGIDEKEANAKKDTDAENKWKNTPAAEHVDFYISQGFEKKEAMKLAAKDRGVSKSEIYKEYLEAKYIRNI